MKRMLSGIKPTGKLTLGNYIGAIKPISSYQDEYEIYFFIANLHCLTIYQDPKELPKMILNPEVKNIFDFTYEDFTLENYNPHPAIKGKVSV